MKKDSEGAPQAGTPPETPAVRCGHSGFVRHCEFCVEDALRRVYIVGFLHGAHIRESSTRSDQTFLIEQAVTMWGKLEVRKTWPEVQKRECECECGHPAEDHYEDGCAGQRPKWYGKGTAPCECHGFRPAENRS